MLGVVVLEDAVTLVAHLAGRGRDKSGNKNQTNKKKKKHVIDGRGNEDTV